MMEGFQTAERIAGDDRLYCVVTSAEDVFHQDMKFEFCSTSIDRSLTYLLVTVLEAHHTYQHPA